MRGAGSRQAVLGLLRAAISLVLAWTVVPAFAANGEEPADNPPITLDATTAGEGSGQREAVIAVTQNAAHMAPGGAADRLVEAARQRGSIRVIVELRVMTRMEHTLTASETGAQRQSLRRVEDAVIERALGSADAPGVTRLQFIPFLALSADASTLRRLLADPQVASVQREMVLDPELADSLAVINADQVFAKGINGTGQVVAVLDTGVAFSSADPSKTHPMLAGKVVSEACYSTTDTSEGAVSLCPRGLAQAIGRGTALNCPVGIESCDHGTHVASIAAGNSAKFDGVARDSKIIAIKVASRFAGAGCGGPAFCARVLESDLVEGLKRVLALRNSFKIAAANMSISVRGGQRVTVCDDEFRMMAAALNNLRAAGIAPIKSSGNNGSDDAVNIPACISSVITVGNTIKNDVISATSNHSALVKLMAPGTNIKAAVPPGSLCIQNADPHCIKSGTSMATPHVAGAFALLRNAVPSASVDSILNALTCTGKIVHERFVAGGSPTDLSPPRPRIDLIGAYNFLKKPPNVVRLWNFANVDQALDWSLIRGGWAVTGGRYHQIPILQGWVGSATANCNSAYTVTLNTTRTDPGTVRHSNTGIIVNAKIDYEKSNVDGYWIAYNKCRTNQTTNLCTGKTEDKPGQAVVWKYSQNFATGVAGTNTLLCVKASPVNVNGLNTIRVVNNGASHSYYLNGKFVCKITDATYRSGPVVVAAFIADAGGHSYQVDSLSVQAIGSGIAAGGVAAVPSTTPLNVPAGMSIAGSSSN